MAPLMVAMAPACTGSGGENGGDEAQPLSVAEVSAKYGQVYVAEEYRALHPELETQFFGDLLDPVTGIVVEEKAATAWQSLANHFVRVGLPACEQGRFAVDLAILREVYLPDRSCEEIATALQRENPADLRSLRDFVRREGAVPDNEMVFTSYCESAGSHSGTLGIFDSFAYRKLYPELKDLPDASLCAHFRGVGIDEGRAGSDGFSVQDYLAKFEDLASLRGDFRGALAHYVRKGIRLSRAARVSGALFPLSGDEIRSRYRDSYDQEYYRAIYPDLNNAFFTDVTADTLQAAWDQLAQHYYNSGIDECRIAKSDFDPLFVRDLYLPGKHTCRELTDLAIVARLDNRPNHLINRVAMVLEREAPFARVIATPCTAVIFDYGYWANVRNVPYTPSQGAVPSLCASWRQLGVRDGTRGSPGFGAGDYLSRHPDIGPYAVNAFGALRHYLLFGISEGRSPG